MLKCKCSADPKMVTMTSESDKGSTSAPKKNITIAPINEIAPNILVYKKVSNPKDFKATNFCKLIIID